MKRNTALRLVLVAIVIAFFALGARWRTVRVHASNPCFGFAEMFRLGMAADDPGWLKMIEDRNLSVHTYNEYLADEIYSRLLEYLRLYGGLRGAFMA